MRLGKNISENISYTEATKSVTAIKHSIDNTPDEDTLSRMRYVAERIFEPVREHFCVPISVTSFYRSPELNKKVGGSKKSQHVAGEAIDIDADVFGMITNRQIFDYIKQHLNFDQLIWEHGDDKEPAWIHVSLKRQGFNKREILIAYKEKDWKGKALTKYKYYED